ncbi:hypothetical protein NUM3379_21270 [Kineococcus sp. NUM-3379]
MPNRPAGVRPLLTTAAALLALALPAAPAAAHDRLLSSDPADGAQLAAAPAAVVLTFSSEVLAVSPRVLVRDGSGAAVADAAPAVDGARVSAALPPALAAGTYTVDWRVASGDGHPVEGTFSFAVTAGPAASPSPSQTPSQSPSATSSATSSAPAPLPGIDAPRASGPQGLLVGAAALLAGAGAVALVLRRRRDPNGPPGQH